MTYRRQRQQFVFAGFLVMLAAVNVLFLFILNRPAQADYANLQDSIKTSKAQAALNRQRLAALQKTSTQLADFDKDKNALLKRHLLERNVGYSEIVTRLDSLVQKTGVKKTRVTYGLNPTPQAGLSAVSITIPLEGNYSNVVNFIREIENSNTFFLITSIDLATSQPSTPQSPQAPLGAAPASTGGVALSLAMETYFYQ